MRAMISHARQFEPRVPHEVSAYIVDEYVRMRQESLTHGATFGFTSARTLLAILRLSQALARLRCANEVARLIRPQGVISVDAPPCAPDELLMSREEPEGSSPIATDRQGGRTSAQAAGSDHLVP